MECKENTVFTGICAIFVLIETSWNVKVIFKSCIIFPSSINRNIVECKGTYRCRNHRISVRINRNIVECKASNFKDSINESVVLIETSWNVKSIAKDRFSKVAMVLIETSWNVKTIAEVNRIKNISY